jgi:hypothetical protein
MAACEQRCQQENVCRIQTDHGAGVAISASSGNVILGVVYLSPCTDARRSAKRGTTCVSVSRSRLYGNVGVVDVVMVGSSGIGIPVNPHQQKDVDFIARTPGDFGLMCADHDWAGMKAEILVQ